MLDGADPRMKLLFNWYFAEEIEHKNVAFDVYPHLYGGYLLQVLSVTLVFPLFSLLNTTGTLYLAWQDRRLFRLDTWSDYIKFLFKEGALLYSLRNMLAYLKLGFKPSQVDNYALAEKFFNDTNNAKSLKEYP